MWGDALRPEGERAREAVFSSLAPAEHRLGLETIYEGYLVHYGRSRLFAPPDRDTALLLGDYLYAHGLVRIAETGDVSAVSDARRAHLSLRSPPGRGKRRRRGRVGVDVDVARRRRRGRGERPRRSTAALAAHARLVG